MAVTPWGFRDILPEEAAARERITDTVRAVFRARGYLPVETPLLEDRMTLEASGGRMADTPFKLFDDDGRVLVVRHDNTLPIVRLVSSRLKQHELPLRLRYEAPVVREQARFAGMARQFTQLGFELVGDGGAEADAEMVSLAIEAMDALGVPDCRMVCGSVLPFQLLLARCGDAALASDALALVHANNFVDLDHRVAQSGVSEAMARAITELPRQHGGLEALDRVDELLTCAGVTEQATAELRGLYAQLGDRARALSFDFSIMNSFDYYTGLVFKAYAAGMADALGSGGRYDDVFDNVFATRAHVPAAGFAFSLERLESALDSRADSAPAGGDSPRVAPLRIAVPKGSLNPGTIEVLERAGLDVSGLRNPGRRLIVPAHEAAGAYADAPCSLGNVEFVIVRATDAPAFVACGGADCGFCGRDSLIEAELDLLELIDLGYGACRFIEAEPAGRADATERAYARRGTLRVATKYPKIAAAWYAQRGIAADIVSLHGNIELGPIVGLSDRIVDITATGTTLRENNLVITGEIMTCTARFFANPGRARLDPRVRELARRLAAREIGAK